MKIRLVGAELFHVDRKTHRYENANGRFFAILRKRLKTHINLMKYKFNTSILKLNFFLAENSIKKQNHYCYKVKKSLLPTRTLYITQIHTYTYKHIYIYRVFQKELYNFESL
jgi:hypothetical protein